MKTPPVDPDIADLASADSALTAYDTEHLVTYLRMLNADEEGADLRDVSRIVLHGRNRGPRFTVGLKRTSTLHWRNSLKALDLKRPIREADMVRLGRHAAV